MLKILREKSSIHKVIGVAAGKGGVGKSLLAVHLALAFIRKGHSVGLIDADIYGPSLQQMFPMKILPRQSELDPTQIIPGERDGLRMITMANFSKRNEAAIIRAPVANAIIDQFLNKIEWGVLEFLIIDFPPGTGDIQLTLMQRGIFSGGLLITTPQEVALIDVRKAGEMFKRMHIPLIGVVENMSYFEEASGQRQYLFGQGGGRRLAAELNTSFLGEIPLDPKLSEAGDCGESIFERAPTSSSVYILEEIAYRVQKQLALYPKQDVNIELLLDGRIRFEEHFLSSVDLQSNCPCASCLGQGKSDSNVGIIQLQKMGRYAVKFHFTSGCSQGIYSFELLQMIARK